MVKTLPFGSIQVPVPGYGAMGLNSGLSDSLTFEQAEPVLLKALELGCTFWDTATVYACGLNEVLLGEFIKKHDCRDRLFIASKCGFEVDFKNLKRGPVTNSAEHIKTFIEGTIERLGSAPDLYYLHRIEPGRDLNESIGALDAIRKAGKTRYIGLSECSAATLRKANSIAKIDAVQAEYSAFETVHEGDGLIDTAKELGIAYIAFSPLGHGVLVDEIRDPKTYAATDFRNTSPKFQGANWEKNQAIARKFQDLAKKKGVSTSQMALAWVAANGLIAIPGTTKSHRIEQNWQSKDVNFTDEEFKQLRALIDGAGFVGNRYGEANQKAVGH